MEDPDLKGRCILLVEDDHMVAKSLARLLELWGAKIVGTDLDGRPSLRLAAIDKEDRLRSA
jgi:hypothetical protein